MGRICVMNFMSIDGVVQSPLSPDEDRDGGFDRGGWVPPYSDEVVDAVMKDATVSAAALLFGRRTHELMTAAWAHADDSDAAIAAMNRVPKHVVASTELGTDWPNSHRISGDLGQEIGRLKTETEGDIMVFGASRLVRGLAELDLVDEYRLLLFPLILGSGKRMFDDGARPARFRLADTVVSPSGVAIHTFLRNREAGP